ncbi:MAG: hypothetical protein JJ911_06370 [Rhizobiaceae bacterium]|nr:hypothetical protein [Rhizobiaceae bacterium]
MDPTMLRHATLALVFVISSALTALAQETGPIGIAITEAPEMGGGVCFADNMDKAFACAREQCASEAGADADCYRVRWCYPAGWSADLFVQNQDGFHSHDYVCGWTDRESLEAAIALKCDRERYPYLMECMAVRMWDNDGNAVELE